MLDQVVDMLDQGFALAETMSNPQLPHPSFKEILTRPLTAQDKKDRVFQIIARQKRTAIFKRQEGQPEPIRQDQLIATLGLLNDLKEGDSFEQNPWDLTTKVGTDGQAEARYQIIRVAKNSTQTVVLITQDGKELPLDQLVVETRQQLEGELTQAPDNPQNKFLKAYLQFKKNGVAVDQTTLADAAKDAGIFTSAQIIEIAQKLGLTQQEIQFLEGKAEAEIPKNADGSEFRPSEKIKNLKTALADGVLDAKQTAEALKLLGIPFTAQGFASALTNLDTTIKMLEASLQSADVNKKQEIQNQINLARDRKMLVEEIREGLATHLGSDNWDLIQSYYDELEKGELDGKTTQVMKALTEGRYEDAARMFNPNLPDEQVRIKAAEMRKTIEDTLKNTAFIGGMVGFFLLFALLTKNER